MSIGAAPNLAGGLTLVAPGGWGRNLQEGVDLFAAPETCCLPSNPNCCLPSDPNCSGCGGSQGIGNANANRGPWVSSVTIAGAAPTYPILPSTASCRCNPSQCSTPPGNIGPWCANVVTTEQSSVGLENVLVGCVETGGWLESGTCAQGCRVTFNFENYQLYHFTTIAGTYLNCGAMEPVQAGIGSGSGYPGPAPSECTTIIVMIPFA